MTKFLKFNSQEECLEVFKDCIQEGVFPSYIGSTAIYSVGLIQKIIPTTEDTPEVILDIPGWHVNLSGEVPEFLQDYLITAPNTPSCVFAS